MGGGMPGCITLQVSTTYAAKIFKGDLLQIRADGYAAHKTTFVNDLTNLRTFIGVSDGYLTSTPSDGKTRGIQVITDVAGCTWEAMMTGSITQANVGDKVNVISHGGVGRAATHQSTAYVSGLPTGMFEIVSLGKDPKDGAESGAVVVIKLSEGNVT